MVDIKTQLQTFKIQCVHRLVTGNDANWKTIPQFYFDKYGKHFPLFKMNFGSEKKNIKLPSFYKNLVSEWVNAGGSCTHEPKSFLNI